MIKNGEREQETAISYLFETYFNYVYTGAKKYKISVDEAQDVYSDAIIAVRNHIIQDRFHVYRRNKPVIYHADGQVLFYKRFCNKTITLEV